MPACLVLGLGLVQNIHGWNYNKNSFMRDKLAETFKVCTRTKLKQITVHSGLECGVFKSKWPDMDIVTFGPVGIDVHTPDERLNLESFDNSHEIFKTFLEAL